MVTRFPVNVNASAPEGTPPADLATQGRIGKHPAPAVLAKEALRRGSL